MWGYFLSFTRIHELYPLLSGSCIMPSFFLAVEILSWHHNCCPELLGGPVVVFGTDIAWLELAKWSSSAQKRLKKGLRLKKKIQIYNSETEAYLYVLLLRGLLYYLTELFDTNIILMSKEKEKNILTPLKHILQMLIIRSCRRSSPSVTLVECSVAQFLVNIYK